MADKPHFFRECMTSQHAELYEKALGLIPWATQTNAKRWDNKMLPDRPPFIKKGKGCRLWDLDDKEYIDFRCSLGPITLGYAYKEVDEAVVKVLREGFLFSMASPLEFEAAEAILDTIRWADKIRYMKTGGEANASCLRLARSFTGRDHFLTSGYHGCQDWFALSWPNNGVPHALESMVHEINYGDLDAVEEVFKKYGDQLAAAVIVPYEWNKAPSKAYLQKLREKCDEYGTVLIFDEVLTGFRLAKGGAPEYFDVIPDMAAFAKGISNGYPLSAFAGKARFMDVLEKTNLTTTYAGETLSLAAAIKVMEILNREPVHKTIFALGDRLSHGFDSIFHEYSLPAKMVGLAPAHCIEWDAHDSDAAHLEQTVMNKLFQKGIFAYNPWFINYSHQNVDIDDTLEKMRKSVQEALQKAPASN